eukprot:1716233-Prymnesium_polylepis.1
MWDKPHGLKNARMASANDARREARAAATAGANAPEATPAAETEEEGMLFDTDETVEDAAEEIGGGGYAVEGTLAHAVGLAARA